MKVDLASFISNVSCQNGNGFVFVTNEPNFGDIFVGLKRGQPLFRLDAENRTGQGRFAMVDMTDGSHVDVLARRSANPWYAVA